jgi:phage baseplate assembly protein W
MATIDRNTGKPLQGIDDVWQSIAIILATPLAALVMARDFGSKMPSLVDRAVSQVALIEFYQAVPQAINRLCAERLMAEEPRFRLKNMQLTDMTSDGHATFDITGLYYPRGQFGEYSVVEDARVGTA